MKPRAAYIHVPFCRHRCGYCNFTVVAKREDLIDSYLVAIGEELRWLGERQQVDTLFFGGGTPTHLHSGPMKRLLASIKTWFTPGPTCEVSMEANPEDVDAPLIDCLTGAGVNRLSLGVQSFRSDKLRLLERAHQADDVRRCFALLRPRIPSISIDLIFGAPGETLAQWRDDLVKAIALGADHISTYGLTYEPGTSFHVRREKRELLPLSEGLEGDMYELAIDLLTAHGFEHYEVSNFARPNHRCKHNENYWKCGEYYGIGPGAASYTAGARRTNHRSTTAYLKKILAGESPVAESETLSASDRMHEHLVFGLRRLEGVRRDEFRQRWSCDVLEVAGENLLWLVDQGLLILSDDVVRLTRRGLLVSDSIWPYLL